MVLLSDITRWGFVQTEDRLGVDDYWFTKDQWMVAIQKQKSNFGEKLLMIYHEGKPRCKEFISGPNDVLEILKKVGYL